MMDDFLDNFTNVRQHMLPIWLMLVGGTLAVALGDELGQAIGWLLIGAMVAWAMEAWRVTWHRLQVAVDAIVLRDKEVSYLRIQLDRESNEHVVTRTAYRKVCRERDEAMRQLRTVRPRATLDMNTEEA